jgi:hypothetical protein
MSNQIEEKEIWIGLAKVKQPERNGVLGDADQAYTNVLALAKTKFGFRKQAKQAIEELGLQLMRLEDAEPIKFRSLKYSVPKKTLALADKARKENRVVFTVFASFDS